MTFFQSLKPANTPPALLKQDRLVIWRDRILQTLLLGVTITSWIVFLIAFTFVPAIRTPGLAVLVGMLLFEITAVTCFRSAPYPLRAGGLLASLVVAILALYMGGNLVLTSIFLLALVVFTSVLLPQVSALICLAFWLVMTGGVIVVRSIASRAAITPAFIATALMFLAVVLAVNAAILFLAKKASESAKAEYLATHTLERERAAMDNRLLETMRPYMTRLVAARAAAEISSHISTINDSDELLKQVVDLMKERFKLYYIGIFVLDSSGRYAVLKAATGEAGEKMMTQDYRLIVGDSSMIGWAVKHKEPRISQDVKLEAVRFNNPYLPDTRSELALPIVSRGASLGAMTIQSVEENAFDEDDILILSGIAGSLAAALENASLDRRLQETYDEVRVLNRSYLQKAWAGAERLNLSYTFENPASGKPKTGSTRHTFPLVLREHIIGEMTVESDQEDLSAEDTALIEAIITQTAIALESARLLEETQQRAFEEQKLNDLSEQFSQAVHINDILRIAVKELSELPSAAEVSIHLLAPEFELTPGHNGNGHKAEVI